MASPPQIVGHYRLDQRQRFLRVLGLGALFVALGSLVTAYGLLHRGTPVAHWVIPVGVALVATGPVTTIFGMHRLLTNETYLAVRSDGLELVRNAKGTLLPWDALKLVRHDATANAIVLERRDDGPPLVLALRFDGITPRAMAAELETHRKRAGLGLLR